MNEIEIQNLKDEMSMLADKQLYKAMIIVSIISFISTIALSFMFQGENLFLNIIFCVLFIISPIAIIPVIIRKLIKRNTTKVFAVIYSCVIGGIMVVLTGFSLLKIVFAFIPYYYLTNTPMFSNKRIKEIKKQLAELEN